MHSVVFGGKTRDRYGLHNNSTIFDSGARFPVHDTTVGRLFSLTTRPVGCFGVRTGESVRAFLCYVSKYDFFFFLICPFHGRTFRWVSPKAQIYFKELGRAVLYKFVHYAYRFKNQGALW